MTKSVTHAEPIAVHHGVSEVEQSGDVPPAAARRVAAELLARFGLGSLMHLELAPGGYLNQNLRATTARGTFFLKGYRYSDPAPIAREHRLMAYTSEQGVPVNAPLFGPNGATFLRVGGRFWAIFAHLSGTQPAPQEVTPAQAMELGRLLGRIHVALAGMPASEAAGFPKKLDWDSSQASREMGEYEAMIGAKPVLDPFDQHALASFAYRRTLLAAGVPPASAYERLPSQILHGDYHAGNVFFGAGGSISAVIDWELAALGPRAWEIVRALDLALPLERDLAAGAPLLRAFVHGYASVAPLTEDECVAMPDLYWAARVHTLWVYAEHYRKGNARTDRLAMEDLAGLHWWATNREALASALLVALEDAPALRLLP